MKILAENVNSSIAGLISFLVDLQPLTIQTFRHSSSSVDLSAVRTVKHDVRMERGKGAFYHCSFFSDVVLPKKKL